MIKKYKKYKPSNVKWIDHLPDHWVSTKIKFISEIFGRIGFRGYTKEDLVAEGQGALTLGAKHIDKNNNLNISNPEFISWDKYYESPEIMVKKGDVILTQRGSLGKVCHINKEIPEATINPSMVIFKNIKVNPRFLYYWLCGYRIQKEIELLQANTAVPMISQFQLGSFPFVNPPTVEQTEIAEYLDYQTGLIDSILDKKQHLIEKLKEQRQAIINQAVTKGLNPNVAMKESGVEWLGKIPEHWEFVKLKFITEKIIDGAHFTPTYVDSGIPFLRVTDIQMPSINLSKVKFIPEEEHKELIKRCKPEKGDVLLSKNGTIGITKVIDWDWEFSTFVSLCLIKFKEEVSPYYFSHFFNSSIVDQQIKVGSKTTSVTNLHLDKIKELIIAIPSGITEQNNICEHLNLKLGEIDDIILKAEKSKEQLKFYRQSIISEAVTGKIDVREWEPQIKETA